MLITQFLCQGLNEPNPAAAEIEEKNALALAIVPIGKIPHGRKPFNSFVSTRS